MLVSVSAKELAGRSNSSGDVSKSNYRTPRLLVRDQTSRRLRRISPKGLGALQSLPTFMDRWVRKAKEGNDPERLLTATINASDGCPVGANSFCGHYCFAHYSWVGTNVRHDRSKRYVEDTQKLQELGVGVSIFLSTDTEPVPGRGKITEVTYELLKEMVRFPPNGLLVHSHTDVLGDRRFLDVLKDLGQATNLIVGIGFDTDADSVPAHLHGHFSSVQGRLDALERIANSGIKTQASVTPLVGFKDFEGFARLFHQMGAYRVMVGELRTKFVGGGATKALSLDLGLPAPSETEALTFFRDLGFPGGVELRETFYVLLPKVVS